jgi:hypothetical protein
LSYFCCSWYSNLRRILRSSVGAYQNWQATTYGVEPKIMAVFYKAVVLYVLLYGSESWVLTKYLIVEGLSRMSPTFASSCFGISEVSLILYSHCLVFLFSPTLQIDKVGKTICWRHIPALFAGDWWHRFYNLWAARAWLWYELVFAQSQWSWGAIWGGDVHQLGWHCLVSWPLSMWQLS